MNLGLSSISFRTFLTSSADESIALVTYRQKRFDVKRTKVSNYFRWMTQPVRPKVILAGHESEIFSLNTESHEILRKTPAMVVDSISSMALAPNKRHLAIARKSPDAILIYDLERDKLLRTLEGHSANLHALKYSDDGKMLASGSMDGSVLIWDPETARQFHKYSDGEHAVTALCFFGRNRGLISVSGGKRVVFVDVLGRKRISTIEASEPIETIALSHDEAKLAIGHVGGLVTLWDIEAVARHFERK